MGRSEPTAGDSTAGIVIRLTGQALQSALSGRRALRSAEFNSVQELWVNLAPEGSLLTATAMTSTPASAARLATIARSALEDWTEHTRGSGRAKPMVDVRTMDTNVIVRANLPSGAAEFAIGALVGRSSMMPLN
jgi:hypothetical protein